MAAHKKRDGVCILTFIFMMLKPSLRMTDRTNCCSDFCFWSCRMSFTYHEYHEDPWLFDCLLCSICCKSHKLVMVKLPFFSHSPSFTLWGVGFTGSLISFMYNSPIHRKVFLHVTAKWFRLIFQIFSDSCCLSDLNFLNLFFISWKLCEVSVLQMKLFSCENNRWLEKEYIFMGYEKALYGYQLGFLPHPAPNFLTDFLNWFL